MKYLFVVLFFLLQTNPLFAQETDSANWLTNLEEAKKEAQKSHKTILVYFTGSDWCPPCKMLKEDFFENQKFLQKADNFILVEIDSPYRSDIISKEQMDYNKKIIASYNKEKSFPKLIALNYKGKAQGEISGYGMLRDTTYYFAFLDEHNTSY